MNDAKSRVKETDIAGYKEMLARGEAARAGRYARRQRMGRGPRGGRGASEQRHHRARYRNQSIRIKTRTLVLYCGGGFRSALVADNLQKMGYTKAISLDGGWRALKDSGLPLEK